MPDFIDDAAVALSLLREALTLLDAPEHARSAAHLRHSINELSFQRPPVHSSSSGKENPTER